MIIECPVCPKPAPRYKIDAALIGDEGRDVRCPRCGHEWFVTPEDFAQLAQAYAPGAHDARDARGGMSAGAVSGGAQYDADVHGGAYGGMLPDTPPIVGATFSCAPPYDDSDEGAPLEEREFASDPLPQTAHDTVSAGAALAIAAASSPDRAGAGQEPDKEGGPHVPSTAAEIASAFFASSFEEPEQEEPGEAPDKPQTSFSLWSALDSVRPEDGYAGETPPENKSMEEVRGARTAFHAAAPQVDDDVDFREEDDFDAPPVYEAQDDDDDALPSGDNFWGRALQGNDDDADPDEPAREEADSASDGVEDRDEELAAALASAANWGNDGLSPEASSDGGAMQRREEGREPLAHQSAEESWEPDAAPHPSEITRLVQALNGHEAAKNAAQEFAAQEYAAQQYSDQEFNSNPEFNEGGSREADKESAWPAERMVHIEDFDRGGGWQAADMNDDASASLHQNAPVAGDRDGAARQAPSFLRTRHAMHGRDDLPERSDRELARSMLARPAEMNHQVEEDYSGEYNEVMTASQPRRMGGLAVAASWGVFLTIVVGLGGAAIHFREGVVRKLPGTARLYQALHAPVASREVKLDFDNVKYRWAMRDDQPIISIEGDIVSRSNAVERVPLLAVAVYDTEHSSPARQFEDVQVEQVEPNGSVHFTVDVASPPKSVNEIALEFKK